MNGGNTALKMIEESGVGQEFASQASKGKVCGIIAIVISVLSIVGGIAVNMMGLLAQ